MSGCLLVPLAGVLILIIALIILIGFAVLILGTVLIIVLTLVIHVRFLRFLLLRTCRRNSIPHFLRFILSLKNNTRDKSCYNCCCNSTSTTF